MAYYYSKNVNVFPTVFRTYTSAGKFTNETNFANIVKSIVDRDSYVVRYESNVLEVVIFGYYFKIEGITTLPYWLAIKVASDTPSRGYNLVNYGDSSTTLDTSTEDNSSFQGLESGSTADGMPTNGEVSAGVIRRVLQIRDSNGKINYARLSTDSIYYPMGPEGSAHTTVKQVLTEVLDNKQEKLTTHNGLKIKRNDNNELSVGLTDANYNKLLSLATPLPNGASWGSNRGAKMSYFDDSGQLTLSSSNAGTAFNGEYFQNVWMSKGVITGGNRVYCNVSAPPTSGSYSNGDIWIRYTN